MADSLKRLMAQKPFSKITVSELIRDCDINRKTFYYHFQDIYELLKWMFDEEAFEIVKHFDYISDFEEMIRFVMDYVDKNDYIINCAYDGIGHQGMKHFLYADFHDVVFDFITTAEQHSQIVLDIDYKDFLCDFYINAIAEMLLDWIKHRKKRDKKIVISYVITTINNSLAGIFNNSPFSR